MLVQVLKKCSWRRCYLSILLVAAMSAGCAHKVPNTQAQVDQQTISVVVDGHMALSSLMALSDGHLLKMHDSLACLAAGSEAKSADWSRIQKRLREIAPKNVAAVIWFARSDGSYWTLEEGRAQGNLTDRGYWPQLMAGQSVLGDLVVSKSTGRNTAIIAVPVFRADRSLAGVLGASIHLDKLTERLRQEMGIQSPYFFYAVDSKPRGALNSDVSLIFTEPKKLGSDISQAFDEMLSRQEGVISYSFRGSLRRVLYRKSPTLGWWYAFGMVTASAEDP